MYIKFDLYTCMLHILRKAYFDNLFMYLGFVFKQNLFSDFMSKILLYIFICILDYIYIQHASMLFQYHVFVFGCVLEKSDFHFKIQKYRFWFSAKFLSYKNSSKYL